MELDRRGAELLFQVLTHREERSAIAIASNEPFSGWTKTFTDPRLCAAIVDRLTFAGPIIETGSPRPTSPSARQNERAGKRDLRSCRGVLKAAATGRTVMPRQIITTANAPSSPLYSQGVKAGPHVLVSGIVGDRKSVV